MFYNLLKQFNSLIFCHWIFCTKSDWVWDNISLCQVFNTVCFITVCSFIIYWEVVFQYFFGNQVIGTLLLFLWLSGIAMLAKGHFGWYQIPIELLHLICSMVLVAWIANHLVEKSWSRSGFFMFLFFFAIIFTGYSYIYPINGLPFTIPVILHIVFGAFSPWILRSHAKVKLSRDADVALLFLYMLSYLTAPLISSWLIVSKVTLLMFSFIFLVLLIFIFHKFFH